MPDTPRTLRTQTVRDRYEYTDPMEGGVEEAVCFYPNNPILDALIGCQGCVVYTEESLLAAGHAYEDAHRAALDTNDYDAGLIAGARAAITEVGGVVADEVVGLREPCGRKVDGNGNLPIRLAPRDILYIVRAKEE